MRNGDAEWYRGVHQTNEGVGSVYGVQGGWGEMRAQWSIRGYMGKKGLQGMFMGV